MNVMNFLEQNVKPATGCTEPIAVAYATSLAYNALFGNLPGEFDENKLQTPNYDNVEKITIKTDRDVYKNALSVYIPGTNNQKGMSIAAAMGLYCNPKKELNLLEGVSDDVIKNANMILSSGKVVVEGVQDKSKKPDIDIQVNLEYSINNAVKTAYTRIQKYHNNITKIQVDGKTLYEGSVEEALKQREEFPETLEEMIDIVKNMTSEEKKRVYKGVEMNKAISEEGLSTNYGLRLGKTLDVLVKKGVFADDLITEVRIKAAGAGDARMGGANMPVMSTAGSGNQGITALIPIMVVGERNNISKDKMSEAALLSHLVTKYISNHTGYLSALCGCAIKAGIGSAAGVTYLLDGNKDQINNAINIMAANITGVICDGAKVGCSLKLSTAAGTATESAFMALEGMKVNSDNGIVYNNAEDTMKAIGKRISDSMVETDLAIVDIMQDKL